MSKPRLNLWRDRTRQKTADSSVLVTRLIALLGLGLITVSLMLPGPWTTAQKVERSSAQTDDNNLAALDDESEVSITPKLDRPNLDFRVDDRNSADAKPLKMIARTILGVPLYVATIDLSDSETFLSVGLANQANQANSARSTRGDEFFVQFVRRHQAALTMSGTFFSMDAQKRVMGNMVSGGEFLKYSPWENYGTTLGVKSGNLLEMVTARTDGKPNWKDHWFSLTAGPRLLRKGQISVRPKQEGFTDPGVMGVAVRSAIGFTPNRKKLLHVTFIKPISLQQEAEIMQALGCWEAMNLDGGTSLALAEGNQILRGARRKLTNVIMVYDTKYPAPNGLKLSWKAFQNSERLAERLPK
ncbi:MAG: phosphodiester glycosidase family protein [Alkalinema sp. CAN_BIN05]|nr:phosphodiester glycosidase family protein [Alkalinema sp. CAN_BIN05]